MTVSKPSNGLTFPFDSPPAPGEAQEIAEGVFWIQIPMPFVLDHINIYAIADGDGWTIVDTGIETPETVSIWRKLLKGVLLGKPIKRVLVTHMHPDHIGMAGWLTRRFECRLWMTRLEYLTCRTLMADTLREAPEDGVRFYREAGWDEDEIDNYRTKFGGFGKSIHPLPDSFRRISDGDILKIGDHEWKVCVGTGHSPEHACFYCPDLNLFLSGDQVIPRISSIVSVFPTEPDANPMLDWLTSLVHLRDTIPEDVLVLPSHKTCFYGLHQRINDLLEGHHDGFDKLTNMLNEPKRAVDVFEALFKRQILGTDLLSMATGECRANLNYLLERKEVSRKLDENGVAWYQRI